MDRKVLDQKKVEEKLAQARERALSASDFRAVSAFYDLESDQVRVILSNGIEFGFPSYLGQKLAGASKQDLAEVELTPSSEGLHWKKLDVDLSIPALMSGIFGTKQWMAEIGKKG